MEERFSPHEEAHESAEQWLAKFAPLVVNSGQFRTADQLRKLIRKTEELSSSATALEQMLDRNSELTDTIRTAIEQLPSIQSELREELSRVAPGDVESRVNLTDLQERLAEREAKQEIGVPSGRIVPSSLDLVTSPPNAAAGVGLGVFGFGWTSFTLVHCVLMIGGMSKAFGWFALGLLGFYSIFFLVGFAMLGAAVSAMSHESVSLVGRQLRITRKFLGMTKEKLIELAPGILPRIGTPTAGMTSQNGQKLRSILFTDVNGKEISVGAMATDGTRQQQLNTFREYLLVHGK